MPSWCLPLDKLVTFRERSSPVMTFPLHGLPQGCSSSPFLQALTLASLVERCPPPPGALSSFCHDDFLVAVPPRWAGEWASVVPSLCSVGGSWNARKCVASGPLASEAVASSIVASESSGFVAWGRPIGDAVSWLKGSLSSRV